MRQVTLSKKAIEAAAKRAETHPQDWKGSCWYNEREIAVEETLVPLTRKEIKALPPCRTAAQAKQRKEAIVNGSAYYLVGFFSGANIPITAQGGNVGVCAAFVDKIPAVDAWQALERIYEDADAPYGAYEGDFDDELDEGRGKAVAAVFRAAK